MACSEVVSQLNSTLFLNSVIRVKWFSGNRNTATDPVFRCAPTRTRVPPSGFNFRKRRSIQSGCSTSMASAVSEFGSIGLTRTRVPPSGFNLLAELGPWKRSSCLFALIRADIKDGGVSDEIGWKGRGQQLRDSSRARRTVSRVLGPAKQNDYAPESPKGKQCWPLGAKAEIPVRISSRVFSAD